MVPSKTDKAIPQAVTTRLSKTSITHSLYIDIRNFMAMREKTKLSTDAQICVNNQERKRENFGEVWEDNTNIRRL